MWKTFWLGLSVPAISGEKMSVENGDRRTDEWRLKRDKQSCTVREEGWTWGSQWWNGRLIWNELEKPEQVKPTHCLRRFISAAENRLHCSLGRRNAAEWKSKDGIKTFTSRGQTRQMLRNVPDFFLVTPSFSSFFRWGDRAVTEGGSRSSSV